MPSEAHVLLDNITVSSMIDTLELMPQNAGVCILSDVNDPGTLDVTSMTVSQNRRHVTLFGSTGDDSDSDGSEAETLPSNGVLYQRPQSDRRPITVAELINILRRAPDDYTVALDSSADWDGKYYVNTVRLNTQWSVVIFVGPQGENPSTADEMDAGAGWQG